MRARRYPQFGIVGGCIHSNLWLNGDRVDKDYKVLSNYSVKKCARCEEVKPVADYYKRSGRSDRYSYCKECQKAYVKKYGKTHPGTNISRAARREKGGNAIEAVRRSDREYQRRRRQADPERKKLESARYRRKYKARVAANRKAYYAVRTGKLNKQPCEKCGVKLVHAHHPDYSKPLKIQWLCPSHHKLAHHY